MNKIVTSITDFLRVIAIILILVIFGGITLLIIKYEEMQKTQRAKHKSF